MRKRGTISQVPHLRARVTIAWHELARESMGDRASCLPTSFDLAPLAPYSGRGAGGEGFTLCFDWYFDREFNDDPSM